MYMYIQEGNITVTERTAEEEMPEEDERGRKNKERRKIEVFEMMFEKESGQSKKLANKREVWV